MNLIFESLAFLEGYTSGYEKTKVNKDDMYIKNAIISLISYKLKNYDDDVMLITNFKLDDNYNQILLNNKIKAIQINFDNFIFEKNLRYSLSYFKLCAFNYILKNFNYNNYIQVDCDTLCMNNLSNIWKEVNFNLLALEIPYSLNSKQTYVYKEFENIFGYQYYFQYYGSEFIACNRENGLKLISKCEDIYKIMIDKKERSQAGDEFVWNCAIVNCDISIKNANPYIMRIFTIRPYIVNSDYYLMDILHAPLEKNCSFLKIYKHYINKGKLYSNHKIYKLLGLKKFNRPFYTYTLQHLKWILKKIKERTNGK